VCWSRAAGTVGVDLLLFVHCAGTYVSHDMGSSCTFSPTRRTSRLVPSWEHCSLSAVKGECVGAVLLGRLVSIFCCLSCLFWYVHVTWTTRLELRFLSNEKDFEAGSFLGAFPRTHSGRVSVLEPCCWGRWCRSIVVCQWR
jgi:hypothetical protein